jgi:hypothetical protein
VLYVHQLPRERNGSATQATATPAVFTSLVEGHVQSWEPVRADPMTIPDSTLDAAQREAVAKALTTPDICLIRGLPGTGKSRVVATLVAQAVARGERVLLLAQSTAAIDQVLALIPARDDLLALRCLGPDERPEHLPPTSRGWTLAERLRHVSTAALHAARQSLSEREQRWQRLRKDEGAWHSLQEIADRLVQIEAQVAALTARRPQVVADVAGEAAAVTDETAAGSNPFQADLAQTRRRHQESQASLEQSLAELRQQLEDQRQQQTSLESQIETIRPLAEARQGKRWWTRTWWRAFFRKELLANLAALDEQRQQLLDSLAELDQEIQRLTTERDQAAAMLRDQLQQLQQAEIARRQAELDNQIAGFDQEAALLRAKWQAAARMLDPTVPAPAQASPEAVQQSRTAWRQRLQQAEQEREFTRRWIACLEETPPWAGLLPGSANLVATTIANLATDPHFGPGTAAGRSFDLLVLQEAEGITEADFRAIAGRARRWVLVGEPTFDVAVNVQQRAYALRKPRPTKLRSGFFDKIWQQLHWEPRGLPYAWIREGERLCCRLRPVPADQRQWLEVENLADSPEIELRIFAPPGSQPVLAEVVFPATFSVAEAKAYLYRELEELTVQTSSRSVRWVEEPHRLLFCLAEEPIPNAQTVDLGSGVQEHVALIGSGPHGAGECTWQTCCLEFDRQAGWERTRAEEWVQHRLGVRDLGRTARLDVPHRMHPHLALFLSQVLFAGEYRLPEKHCSEAALLANGCPCPVEFVAVPPLRERNESATTRGARPPAHGPAVNLSRKGGAGLEVDLSDPRHRSRLPADLGVDLPAQGFVNYAEAQAVVRVLEGLVERPHDWRNGSAERPTVGVIALYEAQVILLRALIQRSAKLAGDHFLVLVDLPAAFRERECAIVLLSLTRSHSHRPVTYGERPELLTLALTRARTQLILLGDAGCLARRSQWEGPLDHLDDLTAARERELVAHLVYYLEGKGGYPHAFHLHEGPGP